MNESKHVLKILQLKKVIFKGLWSSGNQEVQTCPIDCHNSRGCYNPLFVPGLCPDQPMTWRLRSAAWVLGWVGQHRLQVPEAREREAWNLILKTSEPLTVSYSWGCSQWNCPAFYKREAGVGQQWEYPMILVRHFQREQEIKKTQWTSFWDLRWGWSNDDLDVSLSIGKFLVWKWIELAELVAGSRLQAELRSWHRMFIYHSKSHRGRGLGMHPDCESSLITMFQD